MNALARGIEQHDCTPTLGKRNPANERRRLRVGAATTIDDEPAHLKRRDAYPGTLPASESHRIARGIERQSVQPSQPRRHRKRHLCAGAEPRVRRNCGFDCRAVAAMERKRALRRRDVGLRTLRVRALDMHSRGGPHGEPRAKTIQRKPDAAEPAAEPAIEIEKPEMQPRRRADGDARRVQRFGIRHARGFS